MANKKKRNKVYRGTDAAITRPTLTKVSAIKRRPAHQWYVDHKQFQRPVLIGVGILFAVSVVVYGLITIIW